MSATFAGGCRCESVRYESGAEPMLSVYCHCRDCQLSTGGGFAVVVLVPRAAFSLKGQTKSYTVTGETGGTVTRHFCPNCGSPLFSEISANKDIVALKAGSLDDASWVQPVIEVWTERAQPWAKIPGGIATFAKNPPQ